MSITNCLIGKFVSKEELPPGKVSRFVPTLYYTAKFSKFQYLDGISQISFICVRADKLAYYARAVTI